MFPRNPYRKSLTRILVYFKCLRPRSVRFYLIYLRNVITDRVNTADTLFGESKDLKNTLIRSSTRGQDDFSILCPITMNKQYVNLTYSIFVWTSLVLICFLYVCDNYADESSSCLIELSFLLTCYLLRFQPWLLSSHSSLFVDYEN